MKRADPSIPGFRHRTHEPEYERLGLPFCRRDSLRKLSVLLEEEVPENQRARSVTARDAEDARNPKGLPAASA